MRLEDRESLVVAGPEVQTEITYEEIGTVLLMSSEAVRKRVILSADKFRGAFRKILLPVVSGILSA